MTALITYSMGASPPVQPIAQLDQGHRGGEEHDHDQQAGELHRNLRRPSPKPPENNMAARTPSDQSRAREKGAPTRQERVKAGDRVRDRTAAETDP